MPGASTSTEFTEQHYPCCGVAPRRPPRIHPQPAHAHQPTVSLETDDGRSPNITLGGNAGRPRSPRSVSSLRLKNTILASGAVLWSSCRSGSSWHENTIATYISVPSIAWGSEANENGAGASGRLRGARVSPPCYLVLCARSLATLRAGNGCGWCGSPKV